MPSPPQLPGQVHVAPDADRLYDDLGHALMGAALSAVERRGVFHAALSGGSTPEPFYMRLVLDPRFRAMPWADTHVWIVDERRVEERDEKSNVRMIREALTEHVPIRRRNVHAMAAMSDDPAAEYEAELRRVIGAAPSGGGGDPGHRNAPAWGASRGVPELDFVLLGMGGDTHTASLFPGSPAIGVRDRLVVVNDGPAVTPPARVTMTFALLNAAREVAVLVTGTGKAAALRRVEEHWAQHGEDAESMPITGIAEDVMTWYVDEEAVSG